MKGTVASLLWRLGREEQGNTIVLLTTLCLAFIGVTLLTLDVFSILITRRYAQTDADTAAIASVMVIQPIVTQAFAEAIDEKVQDMIDAAIAEWKEKAPETDMGDYVRARLAEQVVDPEVYAYLAGLTDNPPPPSRMIASLLTPNERGCILQKATPRALTSATSRSEGLLRDPQLSRISVEFPFDHKMLVVIRIQRFVPTIWLRRAVGHAPTVTIETGATIRGMGDVSVVPCL